ncbi:hypothetical protein [Actinoplanes sp. NPDC026623]|uniref:hypothetical protein n=1 Tax=Actinoplanes sp. NPDC026623 TaxID=3155610 RepID=UPI0033D7BD48
MGVVTGAGSDHRIIGELQRKIEQDRQRLASLNRGSPAHRQLRRQIIRGAARLRELEQDVRLRADQVMSVRLLLFLLVGGILVLAGWGSWRLLIGAGVAAFGVWIADRLPDHLYRTGLGFHRRAR